MRRSNSNMNSLSTIMRKILKNPKLSKRLDNIKIIEIWNELIGSNLEKYVLDSKVYKGKLYIKLKSSTLRNEFLFKKSHIIKEINSKFGRKVLNDIIFK